MDTELALALGRILERLMICLFAGMAIAGGYHLFKVGIVNPQSADLHSKSFSLKLQKCGPGIFFALFGTIILSLCLKDSLKVGVPASQSGPGVQTPGQPFIYMGTSGPDSLVDVCKSITTLQNLSWITNANGSFTITPSRMIRLNHAIDNLSRLKSDIIVTNFSQDEISFYASNVVAIRENSPSIPHDKLIRLKTLQQWTDTSIE